MALHSVMHWMNAAWSSLATSLQSAKLKMLPCFSEGELTEMTKEYNLKVDSFFCSPLTFFKNRLPMSYV